jgi:FkbM family methyltransferase
MLGKLFKQLRAAPRIATPNAMPNAPEHAQAGEAPLHAPPAGSAQPRLPVVGSAFLARVLGEMSPVGVLDVGAMLTEESVLYGKLIEMGRARVIGFEPDAGECDKLNREIGPPHLFLPYFIGDGADATYYETNYTTTGSLYKPNLPLLDQFGKLAELTQPVAEHAVRTRRLDEIAEVSGIDYIKIDVQGSELKVFEGGIKTLASTLVIHTEVEFVALYEGQPMFADVDRFLRAQGFQFHTFWGFGQRSFKPVLLGDGTQGIHQLLWADAIYVRDWLALEALSVDQLKKYALLMDTVYGSKDLCCKILAHLDARTGCTLASAYVEDWNRSVRG